MNHNFQDVIGHKDIIQYIQNALKTDTASHAYVLSGERGSGKKLLAELFAMGLQCEHLKKDGDVCGECRSCKQSIHGNQPDIIWLHHAKPGSISVDEIREQINNDIVIKPYSSKHKVYIIPDAELMTPQAQNALLKTLEEPPEYGIILLLTENEQALLPTIRSRCIVLKLRNVKDTLIRKYLMEKLEVPDYKADVCTAFAQGNLGKAIMLAQSEHFNEIRDHAIRLLQQIDEMELYEMVEVLREIEAYKLEINYFLDILAIWYRDVLLYKATKDPEKLVFSEQLKDIRKKAEKSSYEGIEIILKSLDKAKVRLRANVNFELTMELLLLTIKEN
jgi:DNA polymerase III subunit delta'